MTFGTEFASRCGQIGGGSSPGPYKQVVSAVLIPNATFFNIQILWNDGSLGSITDGFSAGTATTQNVAGRMLTPAGLITTSAPNTTVQAQSQASVAMLVAAMGNLLGSCTDKANQSSVGLSGSSAHALGTGGVFIQNSTSGYCGSPSFSVKTNLVGFSETPILTPTVAPTVIQYYNAVSGNYGRAGMIIPDLRALIGDAYLCCPAKACSENITPGAYLVPTDTPLSWLSGQYEEYFFCPESRDIIYFASGQ